MQNTDRSVARRSNSKPTWYMIDIAYKLVRISVKKNRKKTHTNTNNNNKKKEFTEKKKKKRKRKHNYGRQWKEERM